MEHLQSMLATGAGRLVLPGLVVLAFVLSVVSRRYRGLPMFASVSPSARFSETWASVRVGTGMVARLGTARNCMHVQVTDDTLELHPHFPFTLGFMPEIYNLDHRIPLDHIRSATVLSHGRLKAVEVKYRNAQGGEGVAQLLLKDAEAFVQQAAPRPAAD